MPHRRSTAACAALGLCFGLATAAAHAHKPRDYDSEEACARVARSMVGRDVVIASATLVAEVTSGPTAAPAHCDVRGTIRGNIKFAVFLPQQDWNGRFQMVGNGGKAGSISFDAMRSGLRTGYATSSTDTGHDASVQAEGGARFGNDALFGRDREIDFGWRAVHLTAQASKQVIRRHYGTGPQHSYWNGCSTGGRQGLMEAQRFPDDFDGYVVGAPVYNYTGQQMSAPAYLGAMYRKIPPSSPADGPVVTSAKRELLGRIVYDGNGTNFAGCDIADGLKDGQIRDPMQCSFNVDQHLPSCAAGQTDTAACFTSAEKDALRPIYAGREPFVPGLPPGGEIVPGSWNPWIISSGSPTLHGVIADAFEWLMFSPDRPGFNYLTQFNWAVDPFLMEEASRIYDAIDPDLRYVRKKGKKILMYHGMADSAANFARSIEYRDAVVDVFDDSGHGHGHHHGHGHKPGHGHGHDHGQRHAENVVDGFLKLYLVPGMGHCSGGVGHSDVDWMPHLATWVEEHRAPGPIVGRKPNTESTRPHCAYPQVAVYDGSGDPLLESSFRCEVPRR